MDGPIRMWNTSWHEIVAEGKGTFHGNGKLSPKAVALIQQQKEEEGAGDEETEEKEEPLYSWFHFQGRHSPVGEFKETTEKYLDEYIRRNGESMSLPFYTVLGVWWRKQILSVF